MLFSSPTAGRSSLLRIVRDGKAVLLATAIALLAAAPGEAVTISVGPTASALTGTPQCEPGFSPASCAYQSYDTTNNLAIAGGGAAAAVASSTIPGFPAIHDPSFLNDGNYGNGRSWIGNSANAWLKIDLGSVQTIGEITFGRDRLSGWGDRHPGQFWIDVALTDAIYANGDGSNDGLEYTNIVNSSALGFSGLLGLGQTVTVDLETLVSARYIKLTLAAPGAAIDEVQVFTPEPSTAVLLGLGLFGVAMERRRVRRD